MSHRLNPCYQLDATRGIWRRPDFQGIAYSDGEDVEGSLLELIRQASDLSVLSTELRGHCSDWVSTYHLSGTRANILRPLGPLLGGDVLEIGAGCGAITRYLGESGGQVLALEGSMRRAEIARSRTRDLQNVTVVADNFESFETEARFDVITLIGVLEYAAQFVSGDRPALDMLRKVKSLLRPSGQMVIAIENQFGLKYFAGANEDHVGLRMFGVENRYQAGGVRTYGRKTLAALLAESGFAHRAFHAAFPDYKLPSTVISEEGMKHETFDAGALASQTSKRDPQLPYLLNFSPDRVWPGLFLNGMAMDMANSFLVVAGDTASPSLNGKLAWHFSAERHAPFCKQTEFLAASDHWVEVRYRRLSSSAELVESFGGVSNDISQGSCFVKGPSLSDKMMDIIAADHWRLNQLGEFVAGYLSFVHAKAGLRGDPTQSLDTPVTGALLDCIPQNIIRDDQGELRAIDAEWTTSEDISTGFLLFRSALSAVYAIHRIGECSDTKVDSPADLIRAVFASVGHRLSPERLRQFVEWESRIQTNIIGLPRRPEKTMAYLESHRIPHQDLATHLYEKVAMLERDAASHLATAQDRMKIIEDRDRAIQEILQSTSWKIGKPVRMLKRLLSGSDR